MNLPVAVVALTACLLQTDLTNGQSINFPGAGASRDTTIPPPTNPSGNNNPPGVVTAGMTDIQRDVLYLFERPQESIALPKGPNGTILYDVADNLVPDGFGIATRLGDRNKQTILVPVDRAPARVSLGSAESIPRRTVFSPFMRSHRRAAMDLINYLMSATTPRELVSLAVNVRDRVNESMFIYALSFVTTHREDMRGVQMPSMSEISPQSFVSEETLQEAQQQVNMRPFMQQPPARVVVEHGKEFTGTNLNPENRVAYWREDYGINSHHWHWHLVNPIDNEAYQRDRKGELFYYQHQQIVARFDHERLSNDLNRVTPLNDWKAPVPEGYFPKLTVQNAGRQIGNRPDNIGLRDVRRGDEAFESFDITTLELYRSRLFMGVHQGWLVDAGGNRVPLNDSIDLLTSPWKRGIDFIGDSFEADQLTSVNYQYYGDLHNLLHLLLAFAHDPDGRHLEEPGVMAQSTTAMRDPIFYRVHKFVDNLFTEYKHTQLAYTDDELLFPDIVMEKMSVDSANGAKDTLYTGWSKRDVEASRGIDFSEQRDVPVIIRLTHLDHRPFVYQFRIRNSGTTPKLATVRIFLAPTHNERGPQFGNMTFVGQKRLWAEMDKFVIRVQPGRNLIERRSIDSSLTLPDKFTFRDLEAGRTIEPGEDEVGDFTGCGWPQHLLVPRGKTGGMPFQFFAMVSDWDQDNMGPDQLPHIGRGSSFCGVLGLPYPDRRPMGFPFDRRQPIKDVPILTTSDFANNYPNMLLHDVSINFLGNNLNN